MEREVTIPSNFQPRPYQLPLLKAMDSGIKRAIMVWNRRSGKDKVCWNYMIRRAWDDVGTYFFLLPTYSQAKKVIWDNIDNDGFRMLDHIPDEIKEDENKSELMIRLANGSIIQLIAADTFSKSSVGTNPKGVVFSEYSISSETAWQFLSPILAVNNGWAIFNFTPRGMNHAWRLLQKAQENPDEWFIEILGIDKTGVLTNEQYEKEIAVGNISRDLAEQEYHCLFIEGATSVFHGIEDIVRTEERIFSPSRGRRYQGGVDLAKHHDYTVCTVIDLHTFDVMPQRAFNQLDWPVQKQTIVQEFRYWNNATVHMDTTGIGDPIYDDLKNLLKIHPYTFNETSREQLLVNLKILIEQKMIRLPDDPVLLHELRSFTYELTGRKVRMQVPGGVHDDRVMSLALACWGLSQKLPLEEERKARKFTSGVAPGIKVRMTNY